MIPLPTADRVRTLAELLEWREAHQGDRPAFAFLDHALQVVDTDSYASLAAAARAVAAALLREGAAGEPVVLAYPPGLDFVRGFWGILLAGAVAVPAYPPSTGPLRTRFAGIVRDSGARLVLAPDPLPAEVGARRLVVPAPPHVAELLHRPGAPDPDEPALVQYTSGSIAEPKGVVLSHRNLLANSRLIQHAFIHTSKSRGLIWLPPYHDMGLIGGIVQPVYAGFRCALMSPRTFLRDPLLWLRAISLTGATTSGGPDSAYEACLSIAEEALRGAGLNLASWTVAFDGAEPISPATLEAFVERFEPYGFRARALMPCYGLAEATLYVCGNVRGRRPVTVRVETEALRAGRVRVAPQEEVQAEGTRSFVSHGMPRDAVRIVSPEERRPCGPGEVGEIWVTGDSVARGYWSPNAAGEAAESFGQGLEPGGPQYLRTGDLGFVHMSELYVTGRAKEVIIIHGQNHYPQDLEATTRRAHPGLAGLPGAAFAVAGEGAGERLVMVQEVARERDPAADPEVIEAVRTAVFAEHAVAAAAVVLVRRGALPKTPSGKIRRGAVRDAFASGTLPALAECRRVPPRAAAAAAGGPAPLRDAGPPPDLRAAAAGEAPALLREWLTRAVAVEIGTAADQIDADTHFGLYGLESVTAARLTARLAEGLGVEIEDTVFWDYPNLNLLTGHLLRQAAAAA